MSVARPLPCLDPLFRHCCLRVQTRRAPRTADLKKGMSVVKRMNNLGDATSVAAVCKDIRTINLARYATEVARGLLGDKLTPAEVPHAVQVASLMHQRYVCVAARTSASAGWLCLDFVWCLVRRVRYPSFLHELVKGLLTGLRHAVEVAGIAGAKPTPQPAEGTSRRSKPRKEAK